jgi:hypothetical protein
MRAALTVSAAPLPSSTSPGSGRPSRAARGHPACSLQSLCAHSACTLRSLCAHSACTLRSLCRRTFTLHLLCVHYSLTLCALFAHTACTLLSRCTRRRKRRGRPAARRRARLGAREALGAPSCCLGVRRVHTIVVLASALAPRAWHVGIAREGTAPPPLAPRRRRTAPDTPAQAPRAPRSAPPRSRRWRSAARCSCATASPCCPPRCDRSRRAARRTSTAKLKILVGVPHRWPGAVPVSGAGRLGSRRTPGKIEIPCYCSSCANVTYMCYRSGGVVYILTQATRPAMPIPGNAMVKLCSHSSTSSLSHTPYYALMFGAGKTKLSYAGTLSPRMIVCIKLS